MRVGEFDQYIEVRVTVLTDGERIEGMLFHMGGTRLSDFLNSPNQQESKFIKVKDPTVYCRRSGDEVSKVPFVMVARDRIVMVMTHTPTEENESESMAGQRVRERATRFLR